jgi:L-ascorbate metabolism protein UlaG (beta-lactamase superfamily)
VVWMRLAALGSLLGTAGACASAASGDRIVTVDGNIFVTPIIGASTQLEYRGLVIHVDPWSAGDYSLAKAADLILISDVAPDHLDVEAIRRIRKPGAPVVIPAAARDQVPDGIIMANGDRWVVGGIEIEAVAMYDLIPGDPFHAPGEGNGYVLGLGGKRVYFAGVTECVPEIQSLRNIHVAFIPMNLPHNRMTPEAAAECTRILGPEVVYPYHYRERPIEGFIEALRDDPIEVRVFNWYP